MNAVYALSSTFKIASSSTTAIFSASTDDVEGSTSINTDDTDKIVDSRPPYLPPNPTPMPEPLPEDLKHSYYLLRHGQSTANLAGIISSARSLAYSEKHGLTPLGWEQGRKSAEQLTHLISKNNDIGDEGKSRTVYFYSSPFARAHQTAQACMETLVKNLETDGNKLHLDVKSDEIYMEDGFMERYFGRLDAMPLETYAYVWPVDLFDPTHNAFEVESVSEVATRIRAALLNIDERVTNDIGNEDERAVVVVASHADTLQITQVYAAGAKNVGTFSQYRFGNGEIRYMDRSTDSLPEAAPLKPPKRGT